MGQPKDVFGENIREQELEFKIILQRIFYFIFISYEAVFPSSHIAREFRPAVLLAINFIRFIETRFGVDFVLSSSSIALSHSRGRSGILGVALLTLLLLKLGDCKFINYFINFKKEVINCFPPEIPCSRGGLP